MPYLEQDFSDPDCGSCCDRQKVCATCEESPDACVCIVKEFQPCPECTEGCDQCSGFAMICRDCDLNALECMCGGPQLPCSYCVTDDKGRQVRA